MDKSLHVSVTTEINAPSEKVWDALTNPKKIKEYLYGAEAITDWKEGSTIVFQGVYDGHEYKDKGNVLKNIPNELLQYNYWTQFSGLPDVGENYSIVTYKLENTGENKTKLTWLQEGFAKEENRKHTEDGLPSLLDNIKKLVES